MSARSLSPTERELIAATAAAGVVGLLPGTLRAWARDDSIRPFSANIPQVEITKLCQRICRDPVSGPRDDR